MNFIYILTLKLDRQTVQLSIQLPADVATQRFMQESVLISERLIDQYGVHIGIQFFFIRNDWSCITKLSRTTFNKSLDRFKN